MQVLHTSFGFIERPPKLHTGYFEMNLNMDIEFREMQKKKNRIYILPFGNISKLISFNLKK